MNISTAIGQVSPPSRASYGYYAVTILFLVHVLGYLDRMAIAVLLPAIKRDLTFSDAELGLLTGIAFTASYALLGIPVARRADRGNRRNVIGIAVIVWSAMTAVCGLAGNFIRHCLSPALLPDGARAAADQRGQQYRRDPARPGSSQAVPSTLIRLPARRAGLCGIRNHRARLLAAVLLRTNL